MYHWIRFCIEIGLILAAIWYLYRLFHGTRGGRAMVGAVLLFGSLVVVTEVFELPIFATLLKTSSAFLVVTLIVVFQPELRRFFSELGEALFQSYNPNQQFLIESIVRAVGELQERGLGALIAVERSMINPQTRESGVRIEGKVSEELLTTIFFNKTPLHDGGVIINGETLVAAGCIFAVTQRQDLDRNLGLRHRAGIGFSEECDAVVVILSEERGEVSLAIHGRLERHLNADRLRQKLTDALTSKSSTRDFLTAVKRKFREGKKTEESA